MINGLKACLKVGIILTAAATTAAFVGTVMTIDGTNFPSIYLAISITPAYLLPAVLLSTGWQKPERATGASAGASVTGLLVNGVAIGNCIFSPGCSRASIVVLAIANVLGMLISGSLWVVYRRNSRPVTRWFGIVAGYIIIALAIGALLDRQ